MKMNELISKNGIKLVYFENVSPITIMDCGEGDTLVFALKSSVHHMSAVETMDIIRRKCSLLFGFIDSQIIQSKYGYILYESLNHQLFAFGPIRLTAW
jgi:hypothetical protein